MQVIVEPAGPGRVSSPPRPARAHFTPEQDVTVDAAAILEWLQLLFGEEPTGFISGFALRPGGGSAGHEVSRDPVAVAGFLASKAEANNAYLGCCLLREPPTDGRGGVVDVGVFAGFWADLDIGEFGHKRKADDLPNPPDEENALKIIHFLPRPTALVRSGGGLYPWWLLPEPLSVDDANRAAFQDASKRLHQAIRRRAAGLGWNVGDTGDLARILRPPGTINHKEGARRSVRLLFADGPRYDIDDVITALKDAGEWDDPRGTAKPAGTARPDPPPTTAKAAGGKKPGPFDVLEQHMEFGDLLRPQGWSFVRQESGGAELWQRPGNPASEYSARAYLNGKKILTVHSDATGLPYGPGNSLTIAQLFAEFHFGGDIGLAAKMLISAAHDRRSVVASIVPMAALDAIEANTSSSRITDRTWEEPLPLTPTAGPPLPVEVLPEPLRSFVSATSTELQVPLDLPFLLALPAIGTLAGNRAYVEVRPGWREPLAFWGIPVYPPSNLKGPTVDRVIDPLLNIEEGLAQQDRHTRAEARALREIYEQRTRDLTAQAAKARVGQREALEAEAVAEAAKLESVEMGEEPQLVAVDVTPEAAAVMLAEQHGCLGIFSDEGGLFGNLAGRYSSGGGVNTDVFNRSFSGKSVVVNRRGYRARVSRATLSMGLAVQPDVLVELGKKREFRGRGFIARMWFGLSQSWVGSRDLEPALTSPYVTAQWANIFNVIAELKTSTSTSHLRRLVLSDDARGVIRDLRCDIEPRMHADTGDLAWMGDWVGKLAGTTVRVAAFLHLVQCPDLSIKVIDRGTMEAAVDLARWAIPHAQIAIKMLGGNQSQADAHRLIAAIRKSGKHEVSERDMQRGTHLDADSVRDAVAMLVERGYLRQLPTPSARSGKRYEPYPRLVH